VLAAIRRNRVRRVVLGLVAGLNLFVVLTIVGGVIVWTAIVGFISIVFRSYRPSFELTSTLFIGAGVAWFIVITVQGFSTFGSRAVRAPRGSEARVHELLERLSIASGLPAPADVGVVDSPAPNALAIGSRVARTRLVVTTGLLSLLDDDELEAVLAAEMIAAARLDTAVRTLAAVYAHGTRAVYRAMVPSAPRPTVLLALWSLVLLPTQMVTRWAWRSVFVRSGLETDDLAVAITRHPEALLDALVKLHRDEQQLDDMPIVSVPLWLEPEAVASREPWPFGPRAGGLLETRIRHLAEVCRVPSPIDPPAP